MNGAVLERAEELPSGRHMPKRSKRPREEEILEQLTLVEIACLQLCDRVKILEHRVKELEAASILRT